MKKILFGIITLFSFNINAQNPVLNINANDFGNIENAYYKDIDNFQNQFVGNWIYTDANKTIRFKFEKKEMFYRQSIKNCYVDYLVGEIQYIENGIEKINSFTNLNVSHSEIFDYSLYGKSKVHSNWYPRCVECPNTVQRIAMSYNEPTNDDACLAAAFVMRREDENGIQKIKIQYILTNGPCGLKNDYETPSVTEDFIIPYGDYTLVKEN